MLYWSKEKFGITPFITVTHVTLFSGGARELRHRDRGRILEAAIFDASLSLTVASDVVGQPEAFYLIYVNRSRANALKGPLAALRRSTSSSAAPRTRLRRLSGP